ncbi:MAG: penicillin-binding protein 2, partial [Rhodobacteraceae bacterium]|nr:penicillin-binding protein 2 [Paracoccaceae bacterium]
ENLRLRHEELRDHARRRAEGRLLVLGLVFLCAYSVIGARMAHVAATEPAEPRTAQVRAPIVAQRADIVDRQGRILATNLETHSLYAQPPLMVDPAGAARALAQIFPDLDEKELVEDFTGKRKFLWIKRKLSPEQKQAVHDIGEPGLLFGPREMRLYPNGRLAAHVLGGAGFGQEAVDAAEVIGIAGVEAVFDQSLRDPGRNAPLQLSIDLSVQAGLEEVLAGGMALMNARGAAAVLMDAHTGEIIAMASLPDFDPNARPAPALSGDPADSPLFNRAVQGVYELGSVLKAFPIAQAIELGQITPDDMIDTRGPMRVGRFRISDYRSKGPSQSVRDVFIHSSNIGTARIAQAIGGEAQRDFLSSLGLLEPAPIEIIEARKARPLIPARWGE